MPDERPTKNQRREQARELARKEREKAQRRDRLLKILIPIVVVVVLLGAAGITAAVVINQPKPAPQTAAGPKNMITGGIQLEGKSGKLSVITTPGLTAKESPKAVADTNADGVPKIVTYVDFSCPACQAFEEANSDFLQKEVAAGKVTLEIHPIAILDSHYPGSRYSSRANNVAACVANYAPDSFYKVMQQMYTEQPTEGSAGLTNSQIVQVVHKAGLNNAQVDSCISGETYKKFVAAQTEAASENPALQGTQGLSTPTILVDGKQYTGQIDQTFQTAIEQLLKA